MLKKIFSYGLIGGLAAGIPLFTLVLTGISPHGYWGMAVGYLIMLIALSTVFIAIKQRRDGDLGGVIRFWPALALGLGISLVAGLIYALAWEGALLVSGTDFGMGYARALIADAKANGMTGEALAQFTAEMEAFAASYGNPLYRIPMTFTEIFPVGVLVSLVSAGLLCNRRFLPARRSPQAVSA